MAISSREDARRINTSTGLTAERPAATLPGVLPGDVFIETDGALNVWKVGLDSVGAKTWNLLVASSGNLSGKYWVSDDLLSPYQTWAAADAACVADGHGPANPAEIIFMPGTYTETITVRPGIALIGLESAVSTGLKKGVKIVGQLVYTPGVAADVAYIRGLYVESPAAVQSLKFGGPAVATLIVENCSFLSDTKSCIQVTNTGAGSLLEIRGCELYNTAGALTDNALLEYGVAATPTLNVRNSTIAAAALNIEAIRIPGTPSGTCLYEFCKISGQTRLTEGNAKFRYCFLESSGVDTIFWQNGQIDAYACVIDAKGVGNPFGRIAAGTASLKNSACTFVTSRETDVNITQNDVFMSYPKVNQVVSFAAPNPPAGTIYDMLLGDTSGGAVATTLPPIKSCPLNHEVFAFLRVAVGAWTIGPAGGDTMIDAAGGAGPAALAAVGNSARFRADTATQTWVQV